MQKKINNKFESTNELSGSEIAEILNNVFFKDKIKIFSEIDSTNNYAKSLLYNKDYSSKIIIADKQTTGRGKRGKSFFSPPGTGIYMTIILEDNDATLLTMAGAVHLCNVIMNISDIKPRIRGVNDVFVNNKKVSGILTEVIRTSGKVWSVLGIGINLFTKEEDFPDDLKNIITSLFKTNEAINRNEFIALLLNEIIDNPVNEDIIKQYYKLKLD